jgi:hypothetical protein
MWKAIHKSAESFGLQMRVLVIMINGGKRNELTDSVQPYSAAIWKAVRINAYASMIDSFHPEEMPICLRGCLNLGNAKSVESLWGSLRTSH